MKLPFRYWLLNFLVLAVAAIAFLFVFMLLVTGARASSCYAIRNMDERLASLAEGAPRPDWQPEELRA